MECRSCEERRKHEEKLEHDRQGARYRELTRKKQVRKQLEIEAAIQAEMVAEARPATVGGTQETGKESTERTMVVKNRLKVPVGEKKIWWNPSAEDVASSRKAEAARKAAQKKPWVRVWEKIKKPFK